MEEYKFREVDHPLFGKIITTQDEAGYILYKATEVAKAIGFIHFGQRLNGKVDFEVITMQVRNPLGYIIRKKVRFVSEKGVREMIIRLGELDTKKVMIRQKRCMKLLQQ
jgi:prophage antirepressor-like protein